MAEDIFDIVDENDAPISSAPRSYVHAHGHRHRASHVLIMRNFAGNEQILLQKRSATKDLYPSHYTTSCSGHVDSGEDYDTAVVREMREETGLSVNINELQKIGKISPCSETGNEFTFVYVYNCPADTKFSAPPDEVESLEWQSVREFEIEIEKNPQKFTPSFLYVWNFYKNKTQQ